MAAPLWGSERQVEFGQATLRGFLGAVTGQLPALKEERDSNLVAGLVGGAKSMFTGGSKKTA